MTEKPDPDHPLIDRVFDGLELGGRLGAELFIRAAKGTKRALERTVTLIDNVGSYTEKRLEDMDRDEVPGDAEGGDSRSAAPPGSNGKTPAHAPEEDEDGIARDNDFSFLDRP